VFYLWKPPSAAHRAARSIRFSHVDYSFSSGTEAMRQLPTQRSPTGRHVGESVPPFKAVYRCRYRLAHVYSAVLGWCRLP